jgi:hypothetical protein
MPSFLEELAAKAGLESDQVQKGVGALLTMLKSKLDAPAFAHLQNSIPNADDALSQFKSKMAANPGGLLDAMKGVAGKVFSKDDPGTSPDLRSHLSSAGISTDQLSNLLPALHEMVAGKLPPQVVDQIRKHVPGFNQAQASQD